jgi:phosphate/sulfate permease
MTLMDLTTMQLVMFGLALAAGFYMAWSIGANDVANAMGTSVGSGALTLKRACILAAIFEFAGALLVGAHVSDTVRSGIFDPAIFNGREQVLIVGMIASLLAAGAWLQVASYFGWPVSTTHTIIGAVVGFGMVAAGFNEIAWGKVGFIGVSWVVSPLLSCAVSYLIFRYVLRQVFFQPNPVEAAKRFTPNMVFVTLMILMLMTVFKGMAPAWKNFKIDPMQPMIAALLVAISLAVSFVGRVFAKRLVANIDQDQPDKVPQFEAAYIARALGKTTKHLQRIESTTSGPMRDRVTRLLLEVEQLSAEAHRASPARDTHDVYQRVERIFVYLQIVSACFVAFGHGGNDVANAIGPLSAAVQAIRDNAIHAKTPIPFWALALGAVGIVVGLATWGWRVIETIGRRITELTPTRGFCAEFGAATTILLATVMGLPISTTHTMVGAVFGVGMARGFGALNLNTVRDIIASWLVTIPAGAGLAIVFYYLLMQFLG